MNSTTATTTLATKLPRWAKGTAAFLAFASAATLTPTTVSADEPPGSDTSALSNAVQIFEENASEFRGIGNDNLPVQSSDGLELGSITLRPDTSTEATQLDGFVSYGELEDHATLIAASDGPGMDRFAIIINEGGADSYTIPADMPDGTEIHQDETGSIDITPPDGEQTTIAPAEAVDAEGNLLPARYDLTNDALTITIDLTDATYPVMVDPARAFRWWGIEQWASRSEVRRTAAAGPAVVWAMKRLCGGHAVCLAVVSRAGRWVLGIWQRAARNGQCMNMKTGYTGGFYLRAYNCNWG